MANIRVDVDYQIVDGMPLTFKAPCPCSEVNGLNIYYKNSSGSKSSKTFTFKDAHGNDLTDINNLFAKDAYVKVVLDLPNGFAYLQNADTNAYLEGKFEDINELFHGKLVVYEGDLEWGNDNVYSLAGIYEALKNKDYIDVECCNFGMNESLTFRLRRLYYMDRTTESQHIIFNALQTNMFGFEVVVKNDDTINAHTNSEMDDGSFATARHITKITTHKY